MACLFPLALLVLPGWDKTCWILYICKHGWDALIKKIWHHQGCLYIACSPYMLVCVKSPSSQTCEGILLLPVAWIRIHDLRSSFVVHVLANVLFILHAVTVHICLFVLNLHPHKLVKEYFCCLLLLLHWICFYLHDLRSRFLSMSWPMSSSIGQLMPFGWWFIFRISWQWHWTLWCCGFWFHEWQLYLLCDHKS